MAGLRQLTGGEEYPQERVILLDGTLPRPVVEVSTGTPTVVHVVEPVDITAAVLDLDDLGDVDTSGGVPGVAYALRRAGVDDPWRLVPTVDAEGLVLRVELGAPGGVAQLGDDGILRAAQRPAVAWTHTQLLPATLWQINHGLGFDPAGVYVEDGEGVALEPARITHPIPGATTEIIFGLPVYGTARLS